MRKQVVCLAFLMPVTSTAFARTLVCSSPNQTTKSGPTLTYEKIDAESGTSDRRSESLSVNAKTIIEISMPGGANIKLGSFQFLGSKTPVRNPFMSDGEYSTSFYAQRMHVVSNEQTPKLLFDDLVFCREKVRNPV